MSKSGSRTLLYSVSTVAISYLISHVYFHEDSPIVSTTTGKLQGFAATSRDGQKYFQFLGIPYAQPPVGRLRFESPQPLLHWNGTLAATRHPPACKGFDFFIRARTQGEEDCLFLNVMTPAKTLNKLGHVKTKLPVIVHIHGGGFHMGCAEEFPGTYFMDEDVVLVTVQYRLGIFGFLTTDDKVIRGNMGLKDQVMALKWIKANIEQFGGDSEQITIMGHSAGGASVHLLMLSKMATGLFHRAITFATDAVSEFWQFNRTNTEYLGYMANYFNCPLASTRAFADCLKQVDAESLAGYHTGVLTPRLYHNPATCGPCIEKVKDADAFLTENPLALLERGEVASKVPWMVGANSNEGLLIVGKFLQFSESTDLLQDDNAFEEYLPHLLFYDPQKSPDAAKRIREYFFRNETYDIEDDETIKALGLVITEKMFYKPLETSSKLQSKVSPVYTFLYSYESFSSLFHYIRWASPSSIMNAEILLFLKSVYALIHLYILGTPKPSYGTAHGDEALLMYDVPINPKILTDIFDLEMSRTLIRTVVDFAHVGKQVRFKGLEWPTVDPNGPLEVMNIHLGEPEVLKDPFTRRLQFWKDLNLPRV